jgi:hypothetical protein
VDTWYYSPYPEPYNGLERLFLCEFCLKYFGKRTTLLRHAAKCALRHPPGDEIYRSPPAGPAAAAPAIAMFEVDGNRSKAREPRHCASFPDQDQGSLLHARGAASELARARRSTASACA